MKRLTFKEAWRLKKAFNMQRISAKNRNIPFLLTFLDWLRIWKESGHLHERGKHRGQYVMARFGDKGAYEINNVRICTVTENTNECWSDPAKRAKRSESISAVSLGKKASPEAKAKMARAQQLRRNREKRMSIDEATAEAGKRML